MNLVLITETSYHKKLCCILSDLFCTCSVGCSLASMFSYNPACEPQTQKNGNAVNFNVAAFDLPLILRRSCCHLLTLCVVLYNYFNDIY